MLVKPMSEEQRLVHSKLMKELEVRSHIVFRAAVESLWGYSNRGRPITVEGVTYASTKAAAVALGMLPSSVIRKLKRELKRKARR